MGVTRGIGEPIVMQGPNQVIGSDDVSPLAMAGAYGTVANNGVYCQPRAIDKVTDSDGNDDPAARAHLHTGDRPEGRGDGRVRAAGRHGRRRHRFARQPVRRHGPDRQDRYPPAAADLAHRVEHPCRDRELGRQRRGQPRPVPHLRQRQHAVGHALRTRARPSSATSTSGIRQGRSRRPTATSRVRCCTDLPNVVGKSIDEATRILNDAGFDVIVGAPVDSSEAEGIVAAQSPGAGQVAGGTTVTISPSNGQGIAIPDVSGSRSTTR